MCYYFLQWEIAQPFNKLFPNIDTVFQSVISSYKYINSMRKSSV